VETVLSNEEQAILLKLAYQAVQAAAYTENAPELILDDIPERLLQLTATFVTLSLDGSLRGCIGTTQPQHALARDVIIRASSAASQDPRFPPIRPEELSQLEIEVSILTPPQVLSYESPQQLLEHLSVEKPGVIIQRGLHRATFLPQVWERVQDPETFLELLCQKASLHRDAWRNEDLQVHTYQVHSYHRKPQSKMAE
jgi:AmmeMemoRadiSam system protein A